jgi:hypothetical protein
MVEEVEELSKYPLFGKYTPDALDQVLQLESDGIDNGTNAKASGRGSRIRNAKGQIKEAY